VALSGKLPAAQSLVDRKCKPINLESAITKFFMGIAFLVIAVVLAVTGRGTGWWFWMLIPSLMFLGSGIAQYIQLKSSGSTGARFAVAEQDSISAPASQPALPPNQTNYVSPESRYKTGDLVPPSVTDGTTKHLEINSEGETMTLPKI
jgi:hypothetical protein